MRARWCVPFPPSHVASQQRTREQAFQTQKEIEQEARALQAQAAKFSRQTAQWRASITTFQNALKELGDFENYVRTLEWDIQQVADALERVAEQRHAGGGPPTAMPP